jgi:hypothetical protein
MLGIEVSGLGFIRSFPPVPLVAPRPGSTLVPTRRLPPGDAKSLGLVSGSKLGCLHAASSHTREVEPTARRPRRAVRWKRRER